MDTHSAETRFVQPLAELTVGGPDGEHTPIFTLRLTDESLVLIPSAETAHHIEQSAGADSTPVAPRLIRWWIGRLRQLGQPGVAAALHPHPLHDTAVTLGGHYLHVRIGPFDEEYGPGEFDPAAAATFVAHYETAKHAS